MLPLSRLFARARQAIHAFLSALANSLTPSLVWGLSFTLVAAPLITVLYQVFDSKTNTPYQPGSWYYINLYYYFFNLGPHLFVLFTLLGATCFIQGRRKWFMLVPIGYTVSKIIWLSMATSNAEFHTIVPGALVLAITLLIAVLAITAQWLIHSKHHQFDAILARTLGVLQAPGLSTQQRTTYIEQCLADLKQYHRTH